MTQTTRSPAVAREADRTAQCIWHIV